MPSAPRTRWKSSSAASRSLSRGMRATLARPGTRRALRPEDAASRIDRGERVRHRLQRSILRIHAQVPRDDGRGQHERRAEAVSPRDGGGGPSTYQGAEEPGRSKAADAGAKRIEEGDRERAHLERKTFGDREVGRARRGG